MDIDPKWGNHHKMYSIHFIQEHMQPSYSPRENIEEKYNEEKNMEEKTWKRKH
tara:strand:+ start:610 stop:768 length:159 start_codon:yes stop_codon:yes gene_type:complete